MLRRQIAARQATLNSHYGIDPKPLDCCGWIGVWPSTFEEAVPKVIRDKMKDGDWVRPWSRMINDILPKQRVNRPQVYYISSANYSEGTKALLKEFKESLDKSHYGYAVSYIDILQPNFDLKDYREDFEKEYSYLGLSKTFNYEPYAICKLQTEETKMEAKKCERCGKLYERADAADSISAYMPGLFVPDWKKENFTELRIRKENTRVISVMNAGEVVDLCPECREKLKNFFEGALDGDMEIKEG